MASICNSPSYAMLAFDTVSTSPQMANVFEFIIYFLSMNAVIELEMEEFQDKPHNEDLNALRKFSYMMVIFPSRQ